MASLGNNELKLVFYLVGVGDVPCLQWITADAGVVSIDGHSREGGDGHEEHQTGDV